MTVTWPKEHEVIFQRHPANPLLTARDWPYAVNTIFNAGAARLADGTTLLLCRVEDRRGVSHLCPPLAQRRGWLGHRPVAHALARPRPIPGREVGHRRPAGHLAGRVAAVRRRLHELFAGRAGRVARADGGFPHLQTVTGEFSPPENKDAALFPAV